MEKYEEETRKYAIWRGIITEGFKNWLKGEKVYDCDKERISLYVSDKTKQKWQNFIDSSNYKTFSKLIRDSVDLYITKFLKGGLNTDEPLNQKTFSKISHALKEPLTSIKGFSQLLLENKSSDLSSQVKSTIENIFTQSLLLEKKIISIIDNVQSINSNYDLLLVEDDLSTVRLITSYLENKGLKCKGVISASICIEELQMHVPKFILLDIVLPDMSGYDLCKKIKSNPRFKNIHLYYLTAVLSTEFEVHLKKTGADGYILKPFDLADFQFIIENLLKN